MKERPILFSTPMVQAILEGRKTQTRRIVKQSPIAAGLDWSLWYDEKLDAQLNQRQFAQLHCPYGKPGDRLWVRENFRLSADQDDKPPSQDYWKSGAWYAADSEGEPSGCAGGAGRLRSAIHMPRWASRLTLEIIQIRVERLQDMTRDDAAAEGVPEHGGEAHKLGLIDGSRPFHEYDNRTTVENYAILWDSINGKDSWESNPWVWIVHFTRVTQERISL